MPRTIRRLLERAFPSRIRCVVLNDDILPSARQSKAEQERGPAPEPCESPHRFGHPLFQHRWKGGRRRRQHETFSRIGIPPLDPRGEVSDELLRFVGKSTAHQEMLADTPALRAYLQRQPWHSVCIQFAFFGSAACGELPMAPDELLVARTRYKVAHEAYQAVARRIAEKLAANLAPTAEEIHEEALAIERLAAARRELLDVINAQAPPRH